MEEEVKKEEVVESKPEEETKAVIPEVQDPGEANLCDSCQ